MKTTLGHILYPDWTCDIEPVVRVFQMLVARSLHRKWRFKGTWTTSGPYESLMIDDGGGYWPDSRALKIPIADGVEYNVKRMKECIWRTMCFYPKLARLDESIPERYFFDCRPAFARLKEFDRARTVRPLNEYHRDATLVHGLRLECRCDGVYLAADVGWARESSCWGLFYLAGEQSPRWNERWRLATWMDKLDLSHLIRKPKERERVLDGRTWDERPGQKRMKAEG